MQLIHLQPKLHFHSVWLWFSLIAIGCVDLTPAWQKTSRNLASSHTGGVTLNGGNADTLQIGGISGSHAENGGTQEIDRKAMLSGGSISGGSIIGNMPTGGSIGGGTTTDGPDGSDTISDNTTTDGPSGSDTISGDTMAGGSGSGGRINGGTTAGGSSGNGSNQIGSSQACASDGNLDSGVCWYLGELGFSCARVCASRGGTSPQASSHTGSPPQGGTWQECNRLMKIFNLNGTLSSGTRQDGRGLGCHVFPKDIRPQYWLSFPDYQDSAAMSNVRIICGCMG